MNHKKIPTNDLDRALVALMRRTSAMPQFLRELGKGELWFLVPFHPEVIGDKLKLENGMKSPFVELQDAQGRHVPLFSSHLRLAEALRTRKVPKNTYAAASMEAMLLLQVLGSMELTGRINLNCKTGSVYLPPSMMRDVADGSALKPTEPCEEVSQTLRIIDPADYPTYLMQPVFEILRQHRNFRAAWVLERGDGGRGRRERAAFPVPDPHGTAGSGGLSRFEYRAGQRLVLHRV